MNEKVSNSQCDKPLRLALTARKYSIAAMRGVSRYDDVAVYVRERRKMGHDVRYRE
jgi:hypothetical protein